MYPDFDGYRNSVRGAVDTPGARAVYAYLASPDAVAPMCVISDFGLPAIGAVARTLETRFAGIPDFDIAKAGTRKQIGRMIRYILAAFGYEPRSDANVRVRGCFEAGVFASGAVYERRGHGRYSIIYEIQKI